ncbi:MAG: ATP-binding protein [Defluviitaleaceae bacterium]|nr:ATP-binding protein [Defluviitaleaceae bacterium]
MKMKTKIMHSMVLLAVVCVVLSSLILMFLISFISGNREETELENRTLAYANALNRFQGHGQDFISMPQTESEGDFWREFSQAGITSGNIRLTLIAPSGELLFDTYAEVGGGDYRSRAEVSQAINTGYGRSRRYSDTLSQYTLYHAVRLHSGDILRLSKTMDSMFFTFANIVPVMIFAIGVSLVVCLILSGSLTSRFTKPLNKINFMSGTFYDENTEIFEEFIPFIRKIKKQEEQIISQYSQLQERMDTINAIISNMHEGIILLDNEQNVLRANKSAARFCGNNFLSASKLSRLRGDIPTMEQSEEGGNAPFLDGGHERLKINTFVRDINFLEGVKTALSGIPCNLSDEYGGRDLEITFSPVKTGKKIDGAIVLFIDVTEKKSAEKTRREFSANVTHELKTPLTVIMGMSEMISEGMVKPDDVKIFAEKICKEAARLLRLIEDILKLSRLDEGLRGEQLEFAVIELGALAGEVLQRLAPVAAQKQVTLVLKGDGKINASRNLIEELLYNLIDNAIKYNKPNGEVVVEVSAGEITVADTGIGIGEQHLERIFERFYRVDKSRAKKTGGTGLGLSIVKHIAEYHGGSVGISSRLGEGSRVRVRLG